MVYNPAEGEYLIAWRGDDNVAPLVQGEYEIFGQRLTAAGAEVGTNDQRISDMGPTGTTLYTAVDPAVAFNPAQGEYLIVWWGDDDTAPLVDDEFEIFGQRLDAGAGVPTVDAGGPYTTSVGATVLVSGTLGADTSTVTGSAWSGSGCTFTAATQLATNVVCTQPGTRTLTLTTTLASGYTITDTATLTVGLCPSTAPSTPFGDIAASFAAAQIACLYAAGSVAGTGPGTYSPAAVVTREQMAVFLMTAYETATGGTYTGPALDQFTDIAGSFAAARIRQLVGLGITAGTAPGIYSPTAPVTREQMAVFIVKLYTAITNTTPAAAANPFTDIGGSFATEQILQLVGLGITAGTTPTTYSPTATVTREQMAVFIVNLVNGAT